MLCRSQSEPGMEFAPIDSARADFRVIFLMREGGMLMPMTNPYLTEGKAAILIDGAYFLRRLKRLNRFSKSGDCKNVDYIITMIQKLCREHAQHLKQPVYHIFFYDCPPFENSLHNPLTGRFVKFKDSEIYKFKTELFSRLKNLRKMALRLGRLSLNAGSSWQITPKTVKKLLTGKISLEKLNPETDILPFLQQKQVDMKIGIDIVSMVLKKQVSTIVLVAGDGDFVPASKFARREGVDFILDPIWGKINPDLNEHIDGLYSVLFNNKYKKSSVKASSAKLPSRI